MSKQLNQPYRFRRNVHQLELWILQIKLESEQIEDRKRRRRNHPTLVATYQLILALIVGSLVTNTADANLSVLDTIHFGSTAII